MSTDTVLYVAQSAAWAAGGFLGGFLAGRTVRDVHRLAQAAETRDTVETQAPARRWRPRGEWVLGLIVLLLAIATVVQGIVQSAATRHVVQCQQDYSNAFADALDARTASSQQAQDALDQLISTFAGTTQGGPPSPGQRERFQQAINDYVAKRAVVKQQQAAHPFPPAPRDLCPP